MCKNVRSIAIVGTTCGLFAMLFLSQSFGQEKAAGQSKKAAQASAASKKADSGGQEQADAVKTVVDSKASTVETEGAQEKKPKSSKRQVESSKAAGISMRLPRFFSGIVDQQQREAIYAVQLEYRARIAELEEELARVKQDELAKMESLLTDSQRKLLAKKRTQSRDTANIEAESEPTEGSME